MSAHVNFSILMKRLEIASLKKMKIKESQSKETPKDNKVTKKSSAAKTKSSIQYKAKADSAVEEDQKVE